MDECFILYNDHNDFNYHHISFLWRTFVLWESKKISNRKWFIKHRGKNNRIANKTRLTVSMIIY